MRFSERVVVVTGAGAGIGRAVARRFGAEGARVVVADLDAESAERAAGDIPGARAAAVDVTDRASVRALMADLPVDVLVNNAGGATDVPFEDIRDHEWDRDVDLCLKGTFLCTQAVLPAMLRRGHGAIVNVASDDAAWITGATLPVDGGLMAGNQPMTDDILGPSRL
jgi:3-oxoacyl-[acyl-carrier protein] reductase